MAGKGSAAGGEPAAHSQVVIAGELDGREITRPAQHPQHRLRLDRLAERIHELGPRALAELLAEIAAPIDVLETYARIEPATLQLVGGDRFPARPLHLAAGGRR